LHASTSKRGLQTVPWYVIEPIWPQQDIHALAHNGFYWCRRPVTPQIPARAISVVQLEYSFLPTTFRGPPDTYMCGVRYLLEPPTRPVR